MENGSVWELWERDGVLTLQLDGMPCANSFTYGSEQAMAEIALSPITRAGQLPFISSVLRPLAHFLALLLLCPHSLKVYQGSIQNRVYQLRILWASGNSRINSTWFES